MIEVTEEMAEAVDQALKPSGNDRDVVAAVLAIVERDYGVYRRPAPEQRAAWPNPIRRLKSCVEQWSGAEIDGDYDPRCCRFPKSCSASVYPDGTPDELLEPAE